MRNRKILYAAAGLIVVYALAGFFALPAFVTPRLISSLEKTTGRSVHVGALHTNPFTLSLTIVDFRLLDRDSSVLVSFSELYVRYQITSLFRHSLALAQLRLDTPYVAIRILRDGTLSIKDLLESPPGSPADTTETPRALEIGDLFIARGSILYQDLSRPDPLTKVIDSLDLELRDFTTAPRKEGAYEFEAITKQDERLHWRGTIALTPLRSEGLIEMANIRARTLTDFLGDRLRFRAGEGTFSASAHYAFDDSSGRARFAMREGRLDVTGLVLTSPSDSLPPVSLPSLHVGGIAFDGAQSALTIDEISAQGGLMRTAYLADGTMTIQQVLMPVPRPGDTSASRMDLLIRKLSTKDFSFFLTDRTLEPDAPLSVTGIDLELHDLRYGAPGTGRLSASAVLNGAGVVRAGGTLSLDPRRFDFDLEIAGSPLGALQPYVERHSRAVILGGTFGLRGKFSYAVKAGASDIRFRGGLTSERGRIGDPVIQEDLLRWERLEIREMDYRTFPPSIRIAEIAASRPYARVIIGRDRTLNLQHIRTADSTKAGAPPDTANVALTTIGKISIRDGSMNFADLSLSPSFTTGIQKLQGSVTELSSTQLARADVDLAGSVDNYAPVTIKGEINPLSDVAYTDILMTFNGIELTTFTPYFSKFAGYKIDRGKLTLNLRYKLNARHLDAENKIVLNQLTLGDKVESPDATSLPVKLAIALLKDSKGLIDLDIPISGSLDDPEFSIFPIVLKVLMNLLWKIVTAPFALLGSLFGGQGDDLQYVGFSPGIDSLTQDQSGKLQTVAKGLIERPALQLEIRGVSSPLEDRRALAEAEVFSKIRSAGNVPSGRQEEKRILEIYRATFKEDPDVLLAGIPAGQEGRDSVLVFRARERLIDSVQISENDLRGLAQRRAAAIREYVTGRGMIDPGRIFLIEVDTAAKGLEGRIRTTMTLTVH
jgi:hypothetical protein